MGTPAPGAPPPGYPLGDATQVLILRPHAIFSLCNHKFIDPFETRDRKMCGIKIEKILPRNSNQITAVNSAKHESGRN